MPTLIIGVLAGVYLGNPTFRANADATVKRAVGVGIDYLNGNGTATIVPQETNEDE